MRRKGNPSALLVGMQTGATTEENSMEFPQKIKIDLLFDPVIPLLGIYHNNPNTPIQKNLCTPMFSASLYTIAKCWKQPKCPSVVEQTKKPWFIYTMAYYAPEKKEGVPTFCDSMVGNGDYYAK